MKIYGFLVLLFSVAIVFAQEQRSFKYDEIEISFYVIKNVKNNRMPNHKAQLIILNNNHSLQTVTSLHEKYRKKETISYFIALPKLETSREKLSFLQDFVKYNFHLDFFDQNTVRIILEGDLLLECKDLLRLNEFIGQVQVPKGNNLLNCHQSFISNKSSSSQNLFTSMVYDQTTLDDMLFLKDEYEYTRSLSDWRKVFHLSATYGRHFLINSFRTTFDEETLVDFADVNNDWSFKIGYMWNERFGANFQIGFLIVQENSGQEFGSVNGNLTVSGSGSGAAILKTGIGGRFLPYIKDRLSIYTDLYIGRMMATAGGGSGTVTVTNGGISTTSNILDKTEKTFYLSPEIGLNYRLGKTLFATTNLNYTYSKFANNIGSVSGFSGFSLNFGLGLSF